MKSPVERRALLLLCIMIALGGIVLYGTPHETSYETNR